MGVSKIHTYYTVEVSEIAESSEAYQSDNMKSMENQTFWHIHWSNVNFYTVHFKFEFYTIVDYIVLRLQIC